MSWYWWVLACQVLLGSFFALVTRFNPEDPLAQTFAGRLKIRTYRFLFHPIPSLFFLVVLMLSPIVIVVVITAPITYPIFALFVFLN